MLEKFVYPFWRDVKLLEVTEKVFSGYIEDVCKQRLAANSLKLVLRIVKGILKLAKVDVFSEKIACPGQNEKNIQSFSVKEQGLIEKQLENECSQKNIGIKISLMLGLRLGEVLALRWEDINFDEGWVFVRRSVYVQRSRFVFTSPKTQSSIRTIPLPKVLIKELKAIKIHTKSEFVVCDKQGKPVIPRTYQYAFASLQKKAGIKNIKGFHSLRHTFATNALQAGMDIKSIADIMGHKNPMITMTRYAHSMFDYKKDILNRMYKK